MSRLATAIVAAVLVASGIPVGAASSGEGFTGVERHVEESAERLARAREDYEAARQRLRELRIEVAATERRLGEARRAVREAQQRQRRQQRRSEDLRERAASRHRELSAQAAAAYRRGGPDASRLWLSVLTSEADLHDVALAEQVSRRLLERDRQLLAAMHNQRRRSRAARRRAREAARTAEARHRELRELADRKQALLEQAREQETARRRAVEELAADHRAQAQLAARLRRHDLSIEAVLTTPRQASFDQPAPVWASRLPEHGRRWAGAIDAAAARAGVEGRFLAALAWTESGLRQEAVSPAGAIGLMQLMPGTAETLGVDPHDPVENVRGGARYLRQQLEAFGNLEDGLAAYNLGPARVSGSEDGPRPVEFHLYLLSVLERWEKLLE